MKKIVALFVCLFVFQVTAVLAAGDESEKTVKIKTSALCEMCEERIEHHMKFEKGVKSVDLDLESNTVTIVYKAEKTDEAKLRTALTKIGYRADDIPADSKAYNKLHGCCKMEGADKPNVKSCKPSSGCCSKPKG